MTYNSSQQFESYVPVYDAVPEEWEDSRPFFVEQMKKISEGVNVREIGWLLDEELLTGQQMFPAARVVGDQSEPQFRSVLRKVIDCSPLVIGLNTFAHGITVNARFSLLHMYAGATDVTGSPARPIPNAIDDMYMDATNVNITVGAAYARCYCVCEYMQEI